ncbi:hypothetical protein H0264_35665 [Nocardia huaxiensis]|uniref:Uncharacterized protein n=1 Tax=Nocardia huaxiensis TaxID=2755382 RepID=A0A7D6Z3U7_9NOCA|nr:hypothetical protein [Nocardia huaxiensis]QLY30404.1 hypothetical protein H0264_35665 [Nocardia huaxiensis]
MDAITELVEDLRLLDWNDIDEVEYACQMVLDDLAAAPAIVRERLDELPYRPELMKLCEHYDILDKIVLHDDETGFRIRLHIFLPGYFDRPHNHRWSYASKILRGQYRHFLYGNAELDEQVDPNKLPVLQVREEGVGSSYALHHSMIHAVVAEPFTASLVIRGPAVKDRFLVMDRRTGEAWWQYGAIQESAEEAEQKRMRLERLREVMGQLAEWKLY